MMDISPSGQTNEAALVQSAYEGNISNVQKLVKKGVNIDALAPCGKNRSADLGRWQSVMSVFTFGRNAPQDQGPQIPPEDVNDANEGPNQKSNKRLSLPLGWMKKLGSSTSSLLTPKTGRTRAVSECSAKFTFEEDLPEASSSSTDDTLCGDETDGGDELVCTALVAAASQGHADLVSWLIKEGADVNLKCCCCGKSALYWAARRRHIEAAQLILDCEKFDVESHENSDDNTALVEAINNDHSEMAELLLSNPGTNVNARSSLPDGYPALHLAIAKNNLKVTRLLLSRDGLACNVVNPRGETALTMAAKNEDISILSLLVSHPRVDIGAKSASSGLRAIHVAAMERNVLAVRLLLTVTQGTNPQQFVQELKGVANEEPANYLMLEIQRLQTMLGAQYEEYNTDIEYYEMNPKQPGSVFILNVKDFDKRSDLKIREGSEKDVDCLKALFRGLNFEVVIPKDEESGKIKTSFTHDEILSALEEYSKGIRASEVSMSVVVVMSHGMRDGKILDSDGKYVKVEEIVEKFTSENCRALDRKPKLFLFQACRGNSQDSVLVLPKAAIDSDASVWEDTRSPLYNDMALVFATAPDFVSYRNTVDGSIFIQKFCKVFNKYVHRLDLHSMLNLVSREVSKFEFVDSSDKLRQTCCIEYRSFWKKLHLCPKESSV